MPAPARAGRSSRAAARRAAAPATPVMHLELAREPRLDDLLEVARLRPGVEPADDRRVPRQVDQRAGPVGGDDLAAADLPVRLAAHAPSSTCDAAQVLQEQVHLGLDVAQRPVGAELPVVLGLEVRVEHLAQQRLGLLQLVLLVLQLDAGRAGSRRRSCATSRAGRRPGSARCAAAPRARLRPRSAAGARARGSASSSRRSSAARTSAICSAPRGGVSSGSAWRASADERPGEAAVERARRERRDARDLDGAVEGLVVVAEALVVRAVARLVDVEERHHQARALVVAADAARRLDVLGVRLRLAEHDHQPEPRDVEADRDHVRGDRAVDALLLVERRARAAAAPRRPCRSDTREVSSTTSENVLRSWKSPRSSPIRLRVAVALDRVLDLLLEDPPRAAELAQAVEVAEHRHVRVGRVARRSCARRRRGRRARRRP